MRTSKDCLVKADELEARANQSCSPDMRTRFLDLARYWRDLARQALVQDVTFATRPPEH